MVKVGTQLTTYQAGVPAHVIHVHMGTQHRVEPARLEAGFRQSRQVIALHVVPARVAALLVVADTGVDHHRLTLGLHDQAVHAEHDFSFGIQKRAQPADGFQNFRSSLGEKIGSQ